jgi:hypothetical protein
MRLLPVQPAWRLADQAAELRWLITNLCSHEAVGIVGGKPSAASRSWRSISLLPLLLGFRVCAVLKWGAICE